MKSFRDCVCRLCTVLFFWAMIALTVTHALAQEAILVGHITLVDGQLLRYVPDERDWVAIIKDAPFGLDDALYSDENTRAEIIMPNRTWLRIGPNTQIQLLTLTSDLTEIDVASGVTRLYNNSSDAMIKATTPFGYAVAEPGSCFDMYVGDESAEVIALDGSVHFVATDTTKYEIVPGAPSVIADANQVGAGDASVDADWDDWNGERDSVWETRMEARRDSGKYLPPELQDESYELEENGAWEKVVDEGEERYLWRPTRIGPWAPFTAGRWTDYYGDQCWVPAESFGYVTHHYGHWVYIRNGWYWAPPVTARGGLGRGPRVLLGLNWYPGRVAWIGTGVDVGWIPLAPNEPYYTHHHWGPAVSVVGTTAGVGLSLASLAYINHAVVVPQTSFYSVNNYTRVRITDINKTTIINNYQTAPVVNNTILKDYSKLLDRHHFTNVSVANKPHQSVWARIEHNQGIVNQQAKPTNAHTLKQTLNQSKPAVLPTQAKLAHPTVSSKIVPAVQVNKPVTEIQFSPGEMKRKTKEVRATSKDAGAKPSLREQLRLPAGEPASVEPKKEVPVKSSEEIQPTDRPRYGTPGAAPEPRHISPTRPAEKVRPDDNFPRSEPVKPAKPPREPRETPDVARPKAKEAVPHQPEPRKTERTAEPRERQRVRPETGAPEPKVERHRPEPSERGQEGERQQPRVRPQAPRQPGLQPAPTPHE
jgi:hypothetical protein